VADNRPDFRRYPTPANPQEPLCMQIIRSCVKNACPQVTVHSQFVVAKDSANRFIQPPFVSPFPALRPSPERVCRLAGRVGSLVERVELAAEEFVHGEHVDGALLEHRLELLVAADLALIGRLLQVVRFDVLP
jgi:hypothetical protein